jgi:TolB-like protein
MFKKIITVVFLAFIAVNTVFSQAVAIDTAISNAAINISERVPNGTRIAVLNISSDYENLSDYIINELIVNLVNTGTFQVVPRSTVEMELVNREIDFQMTGFVSDESQQSLGRFLGAGTVISGSVSRDTANTYRLIINAIHVESFTFQTAFRASIQNDRQIVTLTGGVFFEDYTFEQRIGMGALNMFFGLGSIMNGQRLGWIVTGVEAIGITFISMGLVEERTFITVGALAIGGAVLFGYIIPFFHHKPNTTNVAQANFPFNLELVSSNNQDINGFRMTYNMRF